MSFRSCCNDHGHFHTLIWWVYYITNIMTPSATWLASFFILMIAFRASFHHGPCSWTMEDGLFPWSILMVQLPWSGFLKNKKNKKITKPLGVIQMWTKKNDHSPKSECDDCFNICPKRAIFWKWNDKVKFDHLFVFFCLHLLFPKKIIITLILCQGPLDFFY
jgi:Pyruvate/2-oxoacid:ferredoxin oxidoreductase delta subunit